MDRDGDGSVDIVNLVSFIQGRMAAVPQQHNSMGGRINRAENRCKGNAETDERECYKLMQGECIHRCNKK
jgi:hypothetical protein